MKTLRITSKDDPIYTDFTCLYEQAFPLHEKRTSKHQITALRHARYHLLCFLEQNTLVGFVGYWSFPQYIYIEHYAINQTLRGQGYGSRLLNALSEDTDKTVILEIDPIVDVISEKRLKFYKSLGFVENDYSHNHPPYQDGLNAHKLIVLSSEKAISSEQYLQFKHDLDDIVMFKE